MQGSNNISSKTYRHEGHVGDGKDEAKSGKYRIPSNKHPVLLYGIDSIACFPKIEKKKFVIIIFLSMALNYIFIQVFLFQFEYTF